MTGTVAPPARQVTSFVPGSDSTSSPERAGRALWWATVVAVTLAALPVLVRGAPVADDYAACVDVELRGLIPHLVWMFEWTGIVRPARYLEVILVGGLCRTVPFVLLILVPFALTIGVGLLLRAFLRDLEVPSPWPEIGAVIWLLQPLGAEPSLWPTAAHVPLGLGLALVALRLVHRGRIATGVLVALASYFCVEQVIFAFPAVAWLVAPRDRRWRALVWSGAASLLVLVMYHQWPGSQPRAPLAVGDMVRNVFRGPFFYVRYPATSLGAHSIPLAVAWAFPWSVVLLVAGAVGGMIAGNRLLGGGANARAPRLVPLLVAAAIVAVMLNIPVVVVYPHPTSGRVFTPTWLALAAFGAVAGSWIRWRKPRLAGAVGGTLMAGALLSLSLSGWVRARTADVAERSFRWIGERVQSGGVVAVCDVRRAMVPFAPIGDFHTSEFLHTWLAEAGIAYYTGVRATVRQGGQYWPDRCPDLRGADLVVSVDEMLAAARRSAASP